MVRSLTLLLFLASPASAQEVAYEKFVLDNGLTVILHEDHSLPQVVVNTWYHVGSKDEREGRSGFAHLFEHLMFRGTERVPDSAFDEIMEAGGGYNNAWTDFDCTCYHDDGPSELLPTLLWLEADRMQALGRSMTQEKLDAEREVVRNERRQIVEDQPYGRVYLRSHALLYPPGHPYHDTVIGSHADLEAATLEDVRTFFAEYYPPNNACMVVAGDFDPAATRAEIERLFSAIPRAEDPVHRVAEAVTLERGVVHTMTDRVPFARTDLLYHSPAQFAPGDAELALAAAILGEGVSSRLYRALVAERGLAEEVYAEQDSRMLGSNFLITALARPGVELAELEAAIDEVLATFLEEGPSEEELARVQAGYEAQVLEGLQTIQEKAEGLNLYQFHFGEPNSFRADLDRFRGATVEGVTSFARQVLGAERVVLRVLPAASPPEESTLDERPDPLPAAAFEPEVPERLVLSNGIPVLHWQRADLPLVEVGVLLPVGAVRDPAGRAGMARLVATMLARGAGERDAVAFADALDHLGASLDATVEREHTRLRLTALARNLDPSLDLLADALLRPRFLPDEWERVHRQRLAVLEIEAEQPSAIAERVALEAFFGAEHPYGRPVGGTPASVASIALTELVQFYSDTYRPEGVALFVAGDVEGEALVASLERTFGSWKGLLSPSGRHAQPVIDPPANAALRVLLVDRGPSAQTVVRFHFPTLARRDSARPAHDLVLTVLGGSFTSRLNSILRVERGLTYGARARAVRGPSVGFVYAESAVQKEHTGEALQVFLEQFARLATGDLTAEEAAKARAALRLQTIQSFAGLSGVVSTGEDLAAHGLGVAELAAELAATAELDHGALNAVAPAVVALDRAVLVLVGDASAILPQLEGLDLPEVERVELGD